MDFNLPSTFQPRSCLLRVPKPPNLAAQVAWPGWASALTSPCFFVLFLFFFLLLKHQHKSR